MIRDTVSRRRTIGTPFVLFLLFPMLLMAEEWWETQPYLQWSPEQVWTILNRSPWVVFIQAGIRPLSESVNVVQPSLPYSVRQVSLLPLSFRVSLITASPVREALLRQLASSKGAETTINTEDYRADTEKDRLDRFIATYPDDIRVKGDRQYIIIAVSLRVLDTDNCWPPLDRTCPNWLEEPNADELSRIDASTLTSATSLATNTNRVALLRYEPPGGDRLGAKYYFPRKLPNGAPLISATDKELTFETLINNSRVRTKFNLRKMSYKGKPEA